jgi:predicted phage terminase large subunit-like protein
MVIDDPVDVKSVVLGSNESIRKRLAEIQSVIDISLENRVNDLEAAHWTLIMQRVHQSDPAGAAIESGEWKVIQLQMEFDPTEELNHKDDPRTEFGQLLFPQKFPESALDNLKKKLRHHYSAQYQQMPSSEEGGYVQREWFSDASRYEKTPKVNIYMASDFAVTEKTEKNEPDFTEHGVFGVGPNGHVYVLDWWCGQTNSDVWVESLLDLAAKWRPIAYFPEGGKDWSAVAPLYNMLRKKRKPAIFLRVEPLHPISDKTARARAFQAMASMGFIHFPANAPWAQRIIDQCVDFPAAKHDDAFDVLSAMCRAIDQAHPAILAPAEKPAKKSDYGNNETYRSASSWKTA